MRVLISIIHIIGQILTAVIVINALLSFFLAPTHLVRVQLDKFLNPMLAPIRRLVKPRNGLDFSTLILLLIIYLVEFLLTRILAVSYRDFSRSNKCVEGSSLYRTYET